MFYLLAILSVAAYALQGVLVTHQARKIDGLSMVVYRHATLAISLSPLLLFVDWSTVAWHTYPWTDLLLACVTGVLASSLSFQGIRYLPIAVSRTINRGISVPMSFGLGAVFFAEYPRVIELVIVIFILGAIFCLSREKKSFSHLDQNFFRGVVLTIGAGIFSALTFFFVAKMSRTSDPFLTGYLWEFLMGPVALFFLVARRATGGSPIKRISLATFKRILYVCSPTLIGTGSFVLASRLGSIGVLSAISSIGIVFGLVLAHCLYHEKLARRQIYWILFVMICLVGLRLIG